MITYPEFADTDLSQLALARFQAAVFDLDGVLTRTAVLHAAAWKRALDEVMQALGASLQPFDLEDDYRLYIDGRPRLDGVAAFVRARGAELPTGSPEDPPGAATQWGVSRLKNSYFHDELSRRGVDVFEDAVALADGLRAEGKQLAVVTASENGHLVLQRAGIADRFDAVLTGVEARRWQLPGKPAPDMFLRAADALSTPAGRTLVLEDAVAGVQAGRAGGFGIVVGVDRDSHRTRLTLSGADAVLDDVMSVLTLTEGELAASPTRCLERRYEAFLLLTEGGSAPSGDLREAVRALRATGALVSVARADPEADVAELVRRAALRGIGQGLVLAIGWPRGLTLPPALARVPVVSVAPDPGERGQQARSAGGAGSDPSGANTYWLGGGAAALMAVLHQQEQRRRSGRVPSIDLDPGWTVVVHGDDPLPAPVQQSLLTVADTRFGTRGSREEDPPASCPSSWLVACTTSRRRLPPCWRPPGGPGCRYGSPPISHPMCESSTCAPGSSTASRAPCPCPCAPCASHPWRVPVSR